MPDADKPTIADPNTPLDIDLYCFNCHYNLRGLSGDPIRCPECFHENARGDLLCPPAEVRRRVRKMRRYADFCVVLSFLFLASLAASAAVGPACLVCGVLVLPMAWGICTTQFKNACLAGPGWSQTLLRMNAYGLLWVVGSAGLLSLVGLTTWDLFAPTAPPFFRQTWFWALLALLAITVGFALAGRRYGRFADKLERLARTAVRFELDKSRRRARERR